MRTASPATIRRVWAAVTQEPCANHHRLAALVNRSPSTVHAALGTLRRLGYIEIDGSRARRVIVGLHDVRH